MFRESAKNKAEQALGIVGYRKAAVMLGFGLAVANLGPAAAQTVVGGDGRPQVEIDHSVLDNLGPTPTLPDLLLGRQPTNPATAPVKLHRPGTNPAPVAKAKDAAPAKPKAVAAAPKLKEPKPAKTVAKAEPKAQPSPKPAAKTADATAPAAKKNKSLASNFDAPPKAPVYTPTTPANADMPGAATEPAPAKSVPAPAANSTAKANADAAPAKAQPEKLPEKLIAEKTADAPAAPAAPAPPPVKAEAPAPAPVTKTAEAPAKTEVKAEAKAAAESKVALLTPPPTTSTTADGGASTTIPFAKDGASLSDDGRGALVGVAKRALSDSTIQLQVLAYASGDEDNASKARRLSLSRALAVRSFLIDQGVHSTRIEVRALGNKVPDGAPDRVDLVEQKH